MLPPIRPIGSLNNPHHISSSFTKSNQANQTYDPRPHVNISIINQVFSALLDTGASISLIDEHLIDKLIQQGHQLKSSRSTVFIQDCHSAVQESLGCYYIPFTILPTNMNVSKFNVIFQFHKVKNLSSTVLIGYDFMVQFGCQITAIWSISSFFIFENHIFSRLP